MAKKGITDTPRCLAIGSLLAFVCCLFVSASSYAEDGEFLRAGIIGCDTSHVIAFTKAFNADDSQAGVKVVVAYPGGSDDIPSSRDRVGPFTDQLREMGVEIVDSIDSLLERVDVVLLESVDGRKHLAQARLVLEAGKPVFIDKPIAASLSDAIEIFKIAEAYKTPVFSSSALRFWPSLSAVKGDDQIGEVVGCMAFSPCRLEPHHPDLFWYGIHGVEILFTMMGPDCTQVTRTTNSGADLVTGVWADGRIGTFRGIREGKLGYGAVVFGSLSNQFSSGPVGYGPLLTQISQFFKTGKPPVTPEETLAIIAFMEAAEESKRIDGQAVTLESVFTKAKAEIASGQ